MTRKMKVGVRMDGYRTGADTDNGKFETTKSSKEDVLRAFMSVSSGVTSLM